MRKWVKYSTLFILYVATTAAISVGSMNVAYNAIYDEGVAITPRRQALDFVGPDVTTTDDSVNGRTKVTVALGSSVMTRTSGVVHATTTTDDLAIGGTTSAAPGYVDDGGNAKFQKVVAVSQNQVPSGTSSGSTCGRGDLFVDSDGNASGSGCAPGSNHKWLCVCTVTDTWVAAVDLGV